MMGNFWHREKTTCAVLLTLTGTLWILPIVRMETCNPSLKVRPVVSITSSPKNNRLRIGASMNLTCTAQPRNTDSSYLDRWVNYIEWYDPQGRHVGAKCKQPSNVHAHRPKLSCPLLLKNLTVDSLGFYTCQAGNGYAKHCTRKSVRITGEPPFGVIQPFPENIYPLEYTSANVTCITFDASGGNIKLYTTMTLKNVTIQDDSQYGDLGSYECHAFAKNVSAPKRHGFSVSVITRNEIPTVKVSVSSVLNPDDGIIIFCNLTRRGNENSTPLKRISWFKDGKLLESVRNPDPDVQQGFLAPLKLTKVDVQQGGKYTCLLEVKLRHIKEYNVTDYTVIKVVPWLPKPKEDIKEKASKGSNVSFECAAKGFPLEVEWKVKKQNEDSVQACINGSSRHYKIHQDTFGLSILTLSGVDYSDRGFYYCCLPSNCSQNVEDKCQQFILGVRELSLSAAFTCSSTQIHWALCGLVLVSLLKPLFFS